MLLPLALGTVSGQDGVASVEADAIALVLGVWSLCYTLPALIVKYAANKHQWMTRDVLGYPLWTYQVSLVHQLVLLPLALVLLAYNGRVFTPAWWVASWPDLGGAGFVEKQVLIANAAIMVKDFVVWQQWDFLLCIHHIFIILSLPVVLRSPLKGVGLAVTTNIVLEISSGFRSLMLGWSSPVTVQLHWVMTVGSAVCALVTVVGIQMANDFPVPELENGVLMGTSVIAVMRVKELHDHRHLTQLTKRVRGE